MNHAGSSRNSVRSRPGRCAHDQAVTLHTGHVLAFDEEVDVREIWGWASIHDNLVQHQQIRWWPRLLIFFFFSCDDTSQPAPQGQGRVA